MPSVSSCIARDEALVAGRSGDAGDQVAQLVGAEAVEHDSLERMLAAHLGERLRERMPCVDFGVPEGPDDQQRTGLRGPEHVLEQQQRRPVGPVQIVDDEQRAGRPRELGGDRVEQHVAVVVGGRDQVREPRPPSASANGW